ncbi:MAG: RecQ family ATP-dependent DNA helicase [Clostridia bacterium]|nr:RecQ family ATP-dependent DNA helicase [Clostridia bacterium]
MQEIVFLDAEIGDDGRILDIGAIRGDRIFHNSNRASLNAFLSGAKVLCGHNIIAHDKHYLSLPDSLVYVDTLFLSPLLFPKRPYHALLKDDKLQVEEFNNPVNDAQKAKELFEDECAAFHSLSPVMQRIFMQLLWNNLSFRGFFDVLEMPEEKMAPEHLAAQIADEFKGMFCANSDLQKLIENYPTELAYVLALISTRDDFSVLPPWLGYTFPEIHSVLHTLRDMPCEAKCDYCREQLDIHRNLKKIFGYPSFRTYAGEPLQEHAVRGAVNGESLLAIFPTGGGKSVTFQLPALISARTEGGLTVVLSPLQSLMKDQVDHLHAMGITNAVTINGMLDPIERSHAIDHVRDGSASILYISPEQLRSSTIERLLVSRFVVRFVIDEAHCFSAWGQDFRVDYLYIGTFIRKIEEMRGSNKRIPVSCFTATAKQNVIDDICTYFKDKLDLNLEIYKTTASRENLTYQVEYVESQKSKYVRLRSLLASHEGPAIVYVSRTRTTADLAEHLTKDGIEALPYHGKMESREKQENQERFLQDEVRVIVATSAFGMGVDKPNVGLVVHYDISDSLENYVQEAGRAGRDPTFEATCYVLYSPGDLDKHFILLGHSRLTLDEIQQAWRAVKRISMRHRYFCCTPLEIAREAGWKDDGNEVETRVKIAIGALENAGYLERGRNMPHVYATGIRVRNMIEAGAKLDASRIFGEDERSCSRRILASLLSKRSRANADNAEAESRVDYLADNLGIEKETIIRCVNLMRQADILADTRDMSAYILKKDTENRSGQILNQYSRLEYCLLLNIPENGIVVPLKELNERAQEDHIPGASVRRIRTLLNFMTGQKMIECKEDREKQQSSISLLIPLKECLQRHARRIGICRYILSRLFETVRHAKSQREETLVTFSMVGLYKAFMAMPTLDVDITGLTLAHFEEALLYLSKIGAMRIEGGFMVLYNGMQLERLYMDNRVQYKQEDYHQLEMYYNQKIQQVHIVGEYAHLMGMDYELAQMFVHDYFQMPYKSFLDRYFSKERQSEIQRTVTPEKYDEMFGRLSPAQHEIIDDQKSKVIVVAAGPGSGKTMVLVHKLASLLLLEDVRHEQLLMLTFSRAAATEFKHRLIGLVGAVAHYVEIRTFHSFCFDILGRIGTLQASADIVPKATQMIEAGEVEPERITKTVLVIDEAQDMDSNEFVLVQTLMQHNDSIRVIAVGDDDQNIFGFRGSDSRYLEQLRTMPDARLYEMTDNYRSDRAIVALSNRFVMRMRHRMKTIPIQSASREAGLVRITEHPSGNTEHAIVNELAVSAFKGTTGILTQTNEEALKVMSLLAERHIRARLIQSLDQFRLSDLSEIRCFLTAADPEGNQQILTEETFESARDAMCRAYATSTVLPLCLRMLDLYRETEPRMYKSDLLEYLAESRLEDFDDDGNADQTVIVSTIHKSKGREYDQVLLLLSGAVQSEEEKRNVYVGLTRAKHTLSIHCRPGIFTKKDIEAVQSSILGTAGDQTLSGIQFVRDETVYPETDAYEIQLSHRDVVLDFFRGRHHRGRGICSGTRLQVEDQYLLHNGLRVVKLSKRAVEMLEQMKARQIVPSHAVVSFCVYWQPREENEEFEILLPTIFFMRQTLPQQNPAVETEQAGP